MADEIINKLGFDVSEALSALQRLDQQLQGTGRSFQTFADVLDTWNGRSAAALATMRNLASAATRVSSAMQSAGNATPTAAAPASAQTTSPSLWLPPGVQSAAQQAAQAMASVGHAAQTAGQQATTGMNNAAQATQGARKGLDRLVVSWSTLSRVVMTQMVVRVMSQIRDLLRESVGSAIQFQTAIAEIRTIAPRVGGSFQELASETAEFSKTFNIPLPQVTEGLYETISNQFAGLAERAQIMESSMKLARVAVMDFGDANRLITSTLNAYGMAFSEADSVAAKFFTTINLGQIRGKELADTLGTVTPIAAQLGVSFDELNASIISMTIGGLDAHQTMTGLRAAMSDLIKPSEEMQKVLRGLGFSSPEQIIAAKGWQGALQAIADASDNMASKMGKSLDNVRGLTAGLRLTQSGAKAVQEAMEALAQSTPEALQKTFEEFRTTDVEKLLHEINALKVTLTQDFGTALVQVLGMLMEFAGGADNLSAAIQAIAVAALPAAGALAGLATAFLVLHTAAGPVGWAILAVTAAISTMLGVAAYRTASAINAIRREANEARQAHMDLIKQIQEQHRQAEKASKEAATKSIAAWESQVAVIRKDYFGALDKAKQANAAYLKSAEATTQSMISAQEKVVTAYRNAANESLRIVRQSRQRQQDAEASYLDAVFTFQQRNNDNYGKAEAYMRRARQLAKEAADQLSSAKTEDQVQAALAVQQRAEATAQEAQSIADSTGDLHLQEASQRAILSIQRGKVDAERELQTLQAAAAQARAKEAAEETRRLNSMKVAVKQVMESLKAFDNNGAKTPQQLAKQQETLRNAIATLKKEWLGGKQVSITDLLAMDKLEQRVQMTLEGGITDMEVNTLFASETALVNLRTQIEEGIGPVQTVIHASVAYSPELRDLIAGKSAEEALQLLGQRLKENYAAKAKYSELGDKLDVANIDLDFATDRARGQLQTWLREHVTDGINPVEVLLNYDEINRALQEFTKQATQFSDKKGAHDEQAYQKLKEAYDQYLQVVDPGQLTRQVLQEYMKEAAAVTEQAKAREKAIEGRKVMEPEMIRIEQEIRDIEAGGAAAQSRLEQVRNTSDKVSVNVSAAGTGLAGMAQLNMQNLINQLNQVAAGAWAAAQATANVSPVATASKGGAIRYLASGGPVGTDVLPAMLSPGEVVINAASSRKFASQLIAMNAGVQPVFHGTGGSVTNIGDINVTVQGGTSGEQTARSLATKLRRELRRRTASL
jgi:TP901 family phage tail tape measure protein